MYLCTIMGCTFLDECHVPLSFIGKSVGFRFNLALFQTSIFQIEALLSLKNACLPPIFSLDTKSTC